LRKLVHLVDLITRIYHDGRSHERKMQELITMKLGRVRVLSETLENYLLKTLLW
jgi:hypothetical protein